MKSVDVLRTGVRSYQPYLQDSGELLDPMLEEPTHYGTPCHALCQAVLAAVDPQPERSEHWKLAFRGLDASLRAIQNPSAAPCVRELNPADGSVQPGDPRAYYWTPVMKTYRLLQRQGVAMVDAFTRKISAVDITTCFAFPATGSRAASLLVGEWIRIQDGLSTHTRSEFDHWLDTVLAHSAILDIGFCQEPGHSNANDLFIRLHLATLLVEGYDGEHQAALEQLLDIGLCRSIGLQLSDGSLASAQSGSGQTWTTSAMMAFFTMASRIFRHRKPELAETARQGARRALASFLRWQRPEEPYSPVKNLFPSNHRIGYEPHVMDGHYGNLALSFLADAVLYGFDEEPLPSKSPLPPRYFIDGPPLHRAAIHAGQYSIHLNAWPDDRYDGFGIIDVTFGPGRYFHFASSVRHLATGRLLNLGLALRAGPGRDRIRPMAQERALPLLPIQRGLSDASIRLQARTQGEVFSYDLNVWINDDGAEFEERTPGLVGYKTLLVPYLRDVGSGYETAVRTALSPDGAVVRFRLGNELIRLRVQGAIAQVLHLPVGYQNGRGLCGLLRMDLREPTDTLRYRMTIGR
jgi:hypothetical protein